MKTLFAISFAVLCIASLATWWSAPDQVSEVPVIRWVTDKNPAREQQVELFHDWLVRQGHATPEGNPAVRLRLDVGNSREEKKIIHSVSGVAGDVMDLYNGQQVRLLQAMGVLLPLDDAAGELGFGIDATYAALEPELFVGGSQYAFPANVVAHMLWVNRATFRELGMDPPPSRWTLEEFETIGKEYVRRANKGRALRDRFFVDSLDLETLHRSMGLSTFNETLTATTYDDPRYARALELIYKWTYEDHLLPTAAEMSAFSATAGYGGGSPQLFYRGNYAMMRSGRYMLIQFRAFDTPMDLAVSEPPHGGYPVTSLFTRCVGVYRGTGNAEAAAWFLQYLSGESYNMQIVRDADALPPNPKYTQIEAFKYPPDFPNEWNIETGESVHTAFAEAAENIAVGGTYSPFVLPATVGRLEKEWQEEYMNDRVSAEEAAAGTGRLVEAEIRRTLAEQPGLRERYEALVEQQRRIDALKAEGRPIPRSLVLNPFYLRLYQANGMLVDDSELADSSEGAGS